MSKTIIHADDELDIRLICRDFLNLGVPEYLVVSESSGESVEALLDKGPEEISLVILDNDMPPGSTGLEIIEKYARQEIFRDVPFILFYSGDREIGEKAVIEYGAFDYEIKPDIKGLSNLVKRALA